MAPDSRCDVFLSYAHADAADAQVLDAWLRGHGLRTFFDRRELTAGLRWVAALEEAIEHSGAVAILVGPNGMGNTQQYEKELALVRQSRDRAFPVIPVLLPGCEMPPTGFLELQTWVDLRNGSSLRNQPAALQSLLAALRGERVDSAAIRGSICPYMGLEPFGEEDAAFFCGRDKAIEDVVAQVHQHSFVAVVGRSGSGKSSLVCAGLLPALRRERATTMWDVVSLRPGAWPLHTIAAAFNPASPTVGVFGSQSQLEQEVTALRMGPADMLGRAVDARLDAAKEKPDRLLIYVDQWEELYAMAPTPEDPAARHQHAEDVDRFIALLLTAATDPRARARVALTVRADFYGPLIRHPALSALLPKQQVNIGPMSPEDVRSAIVTPAKKVSVEFSPPNLVDQILNEVGTDEGMLPLLQHALKETWVRREDDRMTADGYIATGGVRGAIQATAERTYAALTPAEQDATRRLFLGLVTPGEGREDTRARIAIPEDPPLREIVAKFSDSRTRLLVTGSEAISTPTAPSVASAHVRATVEVAHEALIRTWPTLRHWLGANRERLRARAATLQQRREWESNGELESLLLPSGFQLERGRALLDDPGDVPVGDIRDYVRLSIEREDRRIAAEQVAALDEQRRIAESERREREVAEAAQRRTKRWAYIVGAVAFLALLASVVAGVERQWAILGTQQALTADLIAGSLNDAEVFPQRSLLFSAEAIKIARPDGKYQREDVARFLPPLLGLISATGGVALVGQGSSVLALAFSPDGHWLATGSDDGTARLWDVVHPNIAPLELRGHSSGVASLAFTPDGRWLATGSNDGTARMWNVLQPEAAPLVLDGQKDEVTVVATSPNSGWLAAAGADHTVQLLNLKAADPSADRVVLSGHTQPVTAVVFSPGGRWLATASKGDHTVRLWDMNANDPKSAVRILTHKGDIDEDVLNAIAFSADERRLAVTFGYVVQIWDLTASDPPATPILQGRETQWIMAAGFSLDGHWVATGSVNANVKLWDLSASDPSAHPILLAGHTAAIKTVAFSSNGSWLVTAGQDGTARLWGLKDPTRPPVVLRAHESWINNVAFSPDAHWLATASDDGQARLWSIPDPALNPVALQAHGGTVRVMAFSPDSKRLVTGSDDTTARVWDVTHLQAAPLVLPGGAGPVTAAGFSIDGHWLATWNQEDFSVRLWNLTAAGPASAPTVLRVKPELITLKPPLMNLAFSPDGHWLATAGPDVNLRLWNMTHGTPSPDPDFSCRQQDPVRGLALTANGREVATGSHGRTARVWELANENPCARPVAILAGSVVNDVAISRDGNWLATASWEPVFQGQLWHLMDAGRAERSAVLQFKDRVFSVAFSSDTHWMAAGAWDGGVQVLDLTDPAKHSFRLPGHQGRVFVVSFDPDGRLLASLSEDHTIRLWDPARPVARPGILRDGNGFGSMVFSPDGRWLATASNDGAVKLWRLQLDDLIELACSLAGRNLTESEWQTFLGESPYSKTCPDLTRP